MPSRTASAEEVVAALDAGLVDLSDADLDPRRAVIACWLRLEQAAAAAGTPRQATDTPTDLVARLLAEHHVAGEVLASFADVYREARFATHTVDERMREQARSALHSLRAELTARAQPRQSEPSTAMRSARRGRPGKGTGGASASVDGRPRPRCRSLSTPTNRAAIAPGGASATSPGRRRKAARGLPAAP